MASKLGALFQETNINMHRRSQPLSKSRTRLLSAVVTLSLVLSGCGGGDTSISDSASSNPLATPDQISAEKLAIQIVASDEVKQAKDALKANWLASATAKGGVPTESLSSLQNAIDESAFGVALSAINNDQSTTKIISILAAPHSWFGLDVPGSRTVFDNPDTTYRPLNIDPKSSYIIKGKINPKAPVDVNFSLWDKANTTQENITGNQLLTDANGNFTIRLDLNSSAGADNHLQLNAASASVFIRNTISEWGTQNFHSLSVERTSGPDLPVPKTLAELISSVATSVRNNAGAFTYYNSLTYAQPVNTFPPVSLGGSAGRLSTQAATYSPFKIADDEALVFTVNLGGAEYFIAPVYTRWMITSDYIQHTQTLNNKQAIANPDGTYTFVISVSDPGVYNWVDTVGVHEGLLNPRWQSLPITPSATPPSGTLKLVKLSDLASVLPTSTRYVTPSERKVQLSARIASYESRYKP